VTSCAYCNGPITGAGHAGRPWPGRAAATYCCFGCLSLGEQRQQEASASPAPAKTGWKLDGLGIRLGIALIVVAQSMIFGLALNLHDDVPQQARWFTQTLILCATLLVVALLGGPLVRAAWRELRRGRVTIEALFLVTMTGAMAASLQAHVTGRGKIYFEVVSVLLVVYTLGKVIGARSRAAALAGSRAWAGQLETCRLVDAARRTRMVPVAEVMPGNVVEVNPGETIAVDGVIRAGVGFISEAPVSGEPFAVVRRPGDRVLAGSASHDAIFRIEATAKGTERQVDRLLTAVESARDRPVSLQARADRLGQWFLPLVVLTALGTFGCWTFLTEAGWEAGLFNAMSVLLVACPCAIGLATPVVIWSALGRLAERGLIVRAGDAVERLAEIDRVMLDKTGTLTDDSLALLDIATTATGDARTTLLGWLSVVQERSNHPVARAFARLPRPFAPGAEPRILALRAVPGCGVEAEIEEHDGAKHIIQIGTPEWIASLSRDAQRSALASQLKASGHAVHVALDGELAAVAVLAERLRDSAPRALAAFRRLGLPVEVLTGDTADRAAALGLPTTRAGMLPDDKRAAVEAAKAEGGRPLFVGDGINDAAALASAHAGISLASATDIAIGASDVTLYHDDLRVIPWAVEVSREAVRAVRGNMYRALCYNLVGMALAAGGVLHPITAAVLMVVSSLSLLFSSTRVGACCCSGQETGETREPGFLTPDSCLLSPDETPPARRAVLHAVALGLQGIVFLLLLEPARELPAAALILGGFALAGAALGYAWHRWATIPHALDMCVGMLTLGNLGMLLGWWADNGFAALHGGGCCRCVEAMREGVMKPWMWVGMLVFANGAMLWLGRRPAPPGGRHAAAMFSGGNLGMAVGMMAGGWCAAQFATTSVPLAVAASFAGMTAGMLAGMLLGTWLTEKLIAVVQGITLPRWSRAGDLTRTAG
jgi:heavy metal translocating P-type ATPase